jgi:xanthine dehydrogenase accessory factor
MRDLLPDIARWLDFEQPFAVATVVAVRRWAPRPPGAKMAVDVEGDVVGTVTGGSVEDAVVAVAQEQLVEGGPARVLSFGVSEADGWAVRMPGGGGVDVLVERFEGPSMELFLELARGGERAALVTELGGRPGGRRTVVLEHGVSGDPLPPAVMLSARKALWEERGELVEVGGTAFFVDVTAPGPKLVRLGSVDYAARVP